MPATIYAPTGVARAPSPATASGGNGVSLSSPRIHRPAMVIHHRRKLRFPLCCAQLAGVGARPT
ncbi:MAG: hypothetical protein WB796_07575, partial [Candidatus Sulfotelmatobacter sp.]